MNAFDFISGPTYFGVQPQQSHLVNDLLKDRHRDMRNLSLVNDLIDIKRMEQDQIALQTGQLSQFVPGKFSGYVGGTTNLIKSLLRDAKYNRRTDEVIANLALGVPHLPRVDEQWQDLRDMSYDLLARQQAQRLIALKEMQFQACQGFGQIGQATGRIMPNQGVFGAEFGFTVGNPGCYSSSIW